MGPARFHCATLLRWQSLRKIAGRFRKLLLHFYLHFLIIYLSISANTCLVIKDFTYLHDPVMKETFFHFWNLPLLHWPPWLFCLFQSDIVHQSVYELVHSEDREELQRQLMWNSFLPSESASLPLHDALSPQHSHLLERSFTVRFRCLLDNTSGFLVSFWHLNRSIIDVFF